MCSQPSTRATGLMTLLAALLLSGCAGHSLIHDPLPPLKHHAPAVTLESVDPLEATPEMSAFADHYTRRYNSRQVRVEELMRAIQSEAMLGFDYADGITLTAADAFARQVGNCLGFSNMVVALAREAGLEANFQLVNMPPQWYSVQDSITVSRHVNVTVKTPGTIYVLDTSGLDLDRALNTKALTDDEARGMFFNNLGAEAMIDGDYATAYAWMSQAIDAAPGLSDTWVNLGVLYGRNGQPEDAERMYQHALLLDSRQLSAMTNLYQLYEDHDLTIEARDIARRVERYRRDNPYYLLYLAEHEMEEGRYAAADEYLDKALELKPGEHLFHFAKARNHYLSGQLDAAETSLEQARTLAPLDRLAEYNRPISELALQN